MRPRTHRALRLSALEVRLVPTVFTVANSADAGPGSLRQAILNANASAGADTIQFASPAGFTFITLTSGELVVTDSVTIVGDGIDRTRITSLNNSRAFRIDGPGTLDVTLSGLSTEKCAAPAGQAGGGVLCVGENLTITSSRIIVNTAAQGGGVAVLAPGLLTLIDSSVGGNSATGNAGGVLAGGGVIRGCSVENNSAGGAGGGIVASGSLTVENSAVWNNTSKTLGGGILLTDPPVGAFILRNTTVSGNSAGTGAGVCLGASAAAPFSGALAVENSTITAGSANTGGGIARPFGTGAIHVESSIVSGNKGSFGGTEIASSGTVTLKTSAVGSTDGFSPTDNGGNLPFLTNVKLAPLSLNGGATRTHALLAGSPAINAGSNPAGQTTDQRGTIFARSAGGAVDIGAYENQGVAPPFVESMIINGGVAQRSIVTSVKVTIDQPVTLPPDPTSAFFLYREMPFDGVWLAAAVSGNSVTLTFTGGAVNGASLADGRYVLTAYASKIYSLGGTLDGNLDGVGGDDFVFSGTPPIGIFRLFGDGDGDGDVDAGDFAALRGAFGSANVVFDADGDGDVDAGDFGLFRARFGFSV